MLIFGYSDQLYPVLGLKNSQNLDFFGFPGQNFPVFLFKNSQNFGF